MAETPPPPATSPTADPVFHWRYLRPPTYPYPPSTVVVRDDGGVDARIAYPRLDQLCDVEWAAHVFLERWEAARVLGICSQSGAGTVELLAAVDMLRSVLRCSPSYVGIPPIPSAADRPPTVGS